MKQSYIAYFLLLLSFAFSLKVHCQGKLLGFPVVEFFGTEDYNAGIQNYSITQDQRGIIYAANNLGLLEYDGSNWQRFSVSSGIKVRSLFADVSGKIFVGAQNELGYFFPNDSGSYLYHSLNHLIPEDRVNFDDIWKIYPSDNGYIFSSTKGLFFFENDSVRFVELPEWVDYTFQYKGKIFSLIWEEGLIFYDNNGWQMHSQGSFFVRKQIASIVTFSNEYDLIATYEYGLFLVNKHKVIPWAENFQSLFSSHKINAVTRLKNGSYAIGTNTDGLYILNQDGKLIYHFTKDKGLKNRTVLSIFEDSFNNIWLGLNNGIAKIEWNSPFSFVNEELDLPGTGYTAFSNNDFLYFGTNNGLHYYPKKDIPIIGNIKKIKGVEGQINFIQRINGNVFVSCHFGAYQLDNDQAIEISEGVGWWKFIETSNPNLLIGGGYSGLYLLEKTGEKWQVKLKYPGFTESSRVMEFDENGILWMTHGYKGVYSFKFSSDYREIIETKFYNQQKGFPSNVLINVFKFNGENVFTAESGFYRYQPEKDLFVPFEKYNSIFGSDLHIRFAIEDSFGNIYFISDEYSGMLRKESWDHYTLESTLFNKIHPFLNDDLERISILDHENIIFSAKDGFIHYNSVAEYTANPDFKILFRNITLSNSESLLLGGSFLKDQKVVNSQPEDLYPALDYQDNSIRFSFSAIDFDQSPTHYRYKLDGYEKEWSEWSPRTEKEYTNLSEGKYIFQVEAKNVFDVLSPVESFRFRVYPPLYRTAYAYLTYIITLLGSLFTLLYFNKKSHVKEKQHLISQQKQELIHRDNILKEESLRSRDEIDRLKNEKLRGEIKHKNKELASSTMHLIDKNDFINSIRNNISEILHNDISNNVQGDLKRIVKNIDKNILEDDGWDHFETHFDEVHGDFLRKIRSDFPRITPQEIKLCAYLRMNMSTKEIANLLKISVRGVEIARYRLRKKLNLNKEENLVNFMLNY